MAYDSPQYQVTRENTHQVTSLASASIAKYLHFAAKKLTAVHALVTTAGTDTAAAIDVYVGTASVGTLLCGTSTAGSVVHSATLDSAIPANGYVELKGKANSATLAACICFETVPAVDSTSTP